MERASAWPLTLLLLFCVPLAVPAASMSPDGRHLAYSYIGGPENIYLIPVEGGEPVALVDRGFRDFRPEWAPDGSHLVFTGVVDGAHVLMRVNPDGTGLEQISKTGEAAGDPDYSPDGSQLIYHTDEPAPRELWVRDVESGEDRALTSTPDFEEVSPRWAPDGRRVVFVGNPAVEEAKGDIWILDAASGERSNLTRTPGVSEFHPDWSHDGSRVVYIRADDEGFAVAVRDLATGEETLVADGNGYAVLDPHFSLDDRSLLFTRTDFSEKGPDMPAIVRCRLEDGAEVQLTQGLYLSQTANAVD